MWSRNIAHAERLAAEVGAQTVDAPEALNPAVDFCVVAVSDDALPAVVERLRMPDSIVLHTSGTCDIELLRNVSPHHGVLWSPMSFVRQEPMDYSTLPYCIEGSDMDTTDAIEQLVRQVGDHVYRLDTRQRRHAHLSAVIANNFGNALLAEVQQLSAQWDIPFEVLQPIILQTAQRAGSGNLWQQQTGPAARHDQSTLDTHRTMLQEQPEMLELYNLFTKLIASKTAAQ